MIYSRACGYAIRALAKLALVRPDGYVLIEELCDEPNLPRDYVSKIFQDLRRSGILISAKGRGGGFALARPPETITLYEIVALIDGAKHFDECVVGLAQCDDDQPCPEHEMFKPIRRQIKRFLTHTTLAQMSKTLERKLKLTGKTLNMPKSKSKPLGRR